MSRTTTEPNSHGGFSPLFLASLITLLGYQFAIIAYRAQVNGDKDVVAILVRVVILLVEHGLRYPATISAVDEAQTGGVDMPAPVLFIETLVLVFVVEVCEVLAITGIVPVLKRGVRRDVEVVAAGIGIGAGVPFPLTGGADGGWH